MKKVLVTGGTGFVGAHVVRAALKAGVGVRCLVRPRSNRANLQGLTVEIVEGDLLDRPSLRRAVAGCDTVFHAAADYRLWVPDGAVMIHTNVQGARHLLETAEEAGVQRVVFTSSVAAVGRPLQNGGYGIGREDIDPPQEQQIGPYKKSKFLSELVAREFAWKGFPVVIVNPSTPIGAYDIKPTPTGKMIVDFLNRRMPAYVETGMNFVDAEDVAAGHLLAAEKGRIGERYILGGQNLTLREFLTLLAEHVGMSPPRFRIPYAVAYAAGLVSTGLAYLTCREPAVPLDGVRMSAHTMYYDPTKAIRELGLPQTPVEQAIQKAVAYFRSMGYVR